MGRVREEERASRRKSETRTSQKKEDAGARKGRKVAEHRVFPMICGSGGSKSRLAKAAGAEPSGQMREEKLHAVVARRTNSKVKMCKHTSASEHFLKVKMSEKVHVVAARSRCRSQNVKLTQHSDHFWTFTTRHHNYNYNYNYNYKYNCSYNYQ